MNNKESFDTLIDMATALQIIPESKQGQALQKALYSLNEISCAVDELEKIKGKIQNLFTTSVCGDTPYYNAIMVDEILNKRISELKG